MKRYLLLCITILAAALSSCKKDSGSSAGNTSKVTIKLTDAPATYDHLYLNVKEVQILTGSGATTTLGVNATIDILKFRMGRDTVIAALDVPAGTIQEVRLVLNPTGNRVVVNGASFDLTTPSGQTSGVKLKVHDDLVAGVAYTMLLDFDAAKSIVTTGNGKYLLKPVIRAVPQAVSGAITGVVNPVLAFPKVYAIQGTDTIGTITDASGKFYFVGMTAGSYRINIEPLAPYKNATIDNVVVTTGAVKDMGTINLIQ